MMPPQMPSRATSSPPKIPWVRRIRMYPTTAITSLSGKPRQSPHRLTNWLPSSAEIFRLAGISPLEREVSCGRRCAARRSGLLLGSDLAADLLHVETADGLDQLLK